MNAEIQLLECVDETGEECSPGELGEIIVTCLDNYSFPIIRYRLGDVVCLDDSTCECGRSLPIVKSVEGRTPDFITLPVSKKRVSPRSIVTAIREVPDLPKFQLVGTKANEVSLRFFSEALPEDKIKDALARCAGLFGDELQVHAETLKEEPKAKIRAVIPFKEERKESYVAPRVPS